MKKNNINANSFADLLKSAKSTSYAPLSKSVCAAMLAGAMVLGGGVFVSPAPAYADGYVSPDGNNIYYGYKSDADYSKDRIKIEVHYYNNPQDAENDDVSKQDPLGKYVHVKYTANLNKDGQFDKWAFRPMWWYGVPKGLQNVHDIRYGRFEELTSGGSKHITPGVKKDSDKSIRFLDTPKDWKGISNFYITDPHKLASMNGLKTLLGIDGGDNKGYDNTGNTAGNWKDFYDATNGMQSMFVDWESAGKRFYQMTYVAELTDKAWKERNEHPLRFAAGVYRFAGNWHIATGQIHRVPKIADHLKVQYPTQTPVANVNSLTTEEQDKVKAAINKANEQTPHFKDLLDGNADITVGADGTATLKFKDNTTLTMPGNLLVVEEKKDNVKFPPIYPAPMGVVNPQKLSTDDQNAIIAAFKKENAGKDFLNKVSKTDSDVYKFDNDKQTLTITYTDGSTITVPYSSLVYQGAKISDWAPYVVPDPIDVVNPSSLSETEKKQVTDAFDKANADLDVYTKAKKDGKTPVSFDKDFKNAIITWADGSTSTIPSWQFLKKKAAAPTPQPPQPAVTKKEFKVTPTRIVDVNFNPFKTTQQEITTGANNSQLTSIKSMLAGYAKDAESGSAVSGVTVEYGVDSTGAGTVTFKADGYNDKTYPMSMFFKQKANNQTSQTPSTETKKYTDPDYPDNTFTYKVTKTEIDGETPTHQEAVKALKQFVKDNYNNVSDDELANVTESVNVKTTWTPKQGTVNMGAWDGTANTQPVKSIQLIGNDIQVNGHQWMEDEGWSAGMQGTLFTIEAKDLYVKKSGAQHQDNTLDNLKKQAKELLAKRKGEGLKDSDFAKAGIDNPSNLNDGTINGMNEKQLRELIRKLTDATKSVYKYNTNPYGVDNPTASPTDDDFQAAVKQFLHANYDDSKATEANKIDNLTFLAPNTATLTGKGWTPKAGTSCLELKSDSATYGITTVSMNNDDSASADFKNGDTVLFTVSKDKLYKKKAAPAPTPSAEDLDKLKKQAEEIIDRNPNLTPEQKKAYKKQIEDAKDQPSIQKILNEAKEQGKKNKNNTDPEVQRIINNNKGGGDEKKQHELDAAKEAAKKAIDNLPNLSTDEKNALKTKVDKANSIDGDNGVNSVVDEAKKLSELNTAKKEAKEAQLYFLDHGKGGKDDSSDPNHNEDAALNELLGTKPAEDSALKTLADKLKANPASASEIRDALNAAKRANAVNEQNAKNAGIAKLEAKKAELVAAYNALTPEQQANAKTSYDAATKAIDDAKNTVNSATKPSQIKAAVDGVDTKIEAANGDIKKNTPKRDTTGNTNDPDAKAFEKEKNDAKGEIDKIPGLSKEEKDKYKDLIDHSTHKGDPEAIVNQAKKHKKIEAALKAIDNFEHLNNAQKEAFKRIIEDTDASDHKNADGTTSDDIDDALANAANTDNAMARLEELKKKANDFKNEQGGKYSKLDSTKPDEKKQKDDFDNYLKDATTLTTPDKGDAKGAAEVNTLYNDLLKAMRAIDPDAKSAGLKTDALSKEIESDKKFKPSETEPKTPGNAVYNTSSKAKKDEFDKVLGEAQTVLNAAKTADTSTADKEAAEQKEIDAALDKLVKARLALDGVDTTDLQKEIDKESATTSSDAYKYDSQEKQNNYNTALQEAKDLIDKLTGKKQAGTDDHLDTKENKQKALDKALAKLKAAEEALKGKKPIEPTPTPTPTPSVDKSHLQQGIDNGSDVHNSDEYNNAPSDKKQAYDHALDHANEVNKDPNATQDQVNQAAEDLKKAENDLKPTPSPLPTPVPGGHEDSGFGVNDNAPTTVDKGELNVQIDSAEADSQPGNAGAGNNNAGNNNAGNANANAANANNNAANGANSAAVNAAVENSPAVKQADAQVAQAQAALDSALAEAKKVAADPNATQAQVDAAAQKLSAARKALASAKAHAAQVRASVRAQVLKRGVSQLSKTGSNVSVIGLLATVAAAGAAFFVSKRRGVSRHSNN
ncbi:sugar-binding protein [Gardnerella sp. Marseille-Q9691]|uniref:sugar-binding protein n=1 Tax=Gardnerella sp. Marseille-Q9691 TaxID=3390096 RepID=UPI003970F198